MDEQKDVRSTITIEEALEIAETLRVKYPGDLATAMKRYRRRLSKRGVEVSKTGNSCWIPSLSHNVIFMIDSVRVEKQDQMAGITLHQRRIEPGVESEREKRRQRRKAREEAREKISVEEIRARVLDDLRGLKIKAASPELQRENWWMMFSFPLLADAVAEVEQGLPRLLDRMVKELELPKPSHYYLSGSGTLIALGPIPQTAR